MSDSDSSSDSDSDEGGADRRRTTTKAPADEGDLDEADETGPAVTSAAQLRTKNEIEESEIVVPTIKEVGPHEALEKVGEVMSIVDRVVIVKGSESEIATRASERALDSDTLLVFEDRKVLGFVRLLLLSYLMNTDITERPGIRSMRPSGLLHNPSTRSNSTTSTHLIPRR